MMGGHQVGLMRGYYGELQRAVDALERDVLNSGSSYHEMTAILDKVAAGELLGRRQDMATNQLLSHALEQLLARGKRQRDTEASTLNMQLVTWRTATPPIERFDPGGPCLTTGGSHKGVRDVSPTGIQHRASALRRADGRIASPVSAQLVVTTPRQPRETSLQPSTSSCLRLSACRSKVREMARRLSALTNLRKYTMEDVPRWRTHGGDFFFAQPYNDALIFGDPWVPPSPT